MCVHVPFRQASKYFIVSVQFFPIAIDFSTQSHTHTHTCNGDINTRAIPLLFINFSSPLLLLYIQCPQLRYYGTCTYIYTSLLLVTAFEQNLTNAAHFPFFLLYRRLKNSLFFSVYTIALKFTSVCVCVFC